MEHEQGSRTVGDGERSARTAPAEGKNGADLAGGGGEADAVGAAGVADDQKRSGGRVVGRQGGARGKRVGIDGVSAFFGMRWEDRETVWLTIRPELINAGGLLSGVATYAMVDYCMGSTLWPETSEEERIATISISINYIQTAVEGNVVCRTKLDRRNRSNAVMRSDVSHEDGRLLATAIGNYAIFVPHRHEKGSGLDGRGDPGASDDGG